MLVNSLSPWFGAKRSLSEPLARAIGKPSAFWDVFCGSCAVLFSIPRASLEVVNDLNGDLINLARAVASTSWEALFNRLERTFIGPDVFAESAAVIEGDPFTLNDGFDPGRAYHFMVYSWQGRSGTLGTVGKQSFAMRYTSNGGNQARRFRSAVDSMPEWADRLRHATILNDDAFAIIPKIEDKRGTVVYADPPYLKKAARYKHDFDPCPACAGAPNPCSCGACVEPGRQHNNGPCRACRTCRGKDAHARLAEALRRFKLTRVVVSYYDHPRLAQLYPGWKLERVEVTKAMAQPSKRDQEGATKAVEVILTNTTTTENPTPCAHSTDLSA